MSHEASGINTIIDYSHRRTWGRKLIESVVSLCAWSTWIWLIAPLGTTLLWVGSGGLFHREFLAGDNAVVTWHYLLWSGCFSVCIVLAGLFFYILSLVADYRRNGTFAKSQNQERSSEAVFAERHELRQNLHRHFSVKAINPATGQGPFATMQVRLNEEPSEGGVSKVCLEVIRLS